LTIPSSAKDIYRRSTSLDFLDRCPAPVAAFYRYWESKRAGRAMPSRADLDLAEMKVFLSGVVLVDVLRDPFRLVYRVVGTREVEARGYDPTGREVIEHASGTAHGEVMENYRLVIEGRSFVYDEEPVEAASWRIRESGTLLLPLSRDGETVDMVITYVHYDWT